MVYWVNEDRPTNSAMVHRGDCPYGVPRYKKSEDGRWHGPYYTLGKAELVARDTGHEVSKCQTCKP